MPLTELKLVERIRRQAGRSGARRRGLLGIGDDCAVLQLPRGAEALITTDLSIEGVHFRHAWHPAESVGHRCLTRGLSDIAAMGGEPMAAFLSLGLPREVPQSWADGFMRGLLRLARQFRVTLAGGDTAESPSDILADIVVFGAVPRGEAILRSGARPGDVLYVTGELGGSARTLSQFFAGKSPRPKSHPAHFYPTPRVAVGQVLRKGGLASSMIDLSDGLSTDLAHLCEESGVAAVIEAGAVPLAAGCDLALALNGGEDYELLFTAPAKTRIPERIAGVRVTPIGNVQRGRGAWILDHKGRRKRLERKGWEHFR